MTFEQHICINGFEPELAVLLNYYEDLSSEDIPMQVVSGYYLAFDHEINAKELKMESVSKVGTMHSHFSLGEIIRTFFNFLISLQRELSLIYAKIKITYTYNPTKY
ncbi:hypothetical protein HZS_1685 [Henneguya salminicola]|nr:hypothetical protein HZS_1685 [Henneguya salminicola]